MNDEAEATLEELEAREHELVRRLCATLGAINERRGTKAPAAGPMTPEQVQIIALEAVVATVCESERQALNSLAEARDELEELRDRKA